MAFIDDPETLAFGDAKEGDSDGRGRLKVFLGYASGIGKSHRMFAEGCRRKERGQDVIVGATQTPIAPGIEEFLGKLEGIPMKIASGVAAMDVDAILLRRPLICIVDGLAYDNPPQSRHPHRWQDVEQLLNAGITVITAVNLQFIDRQQQAVEKITGRHVAESVPETFLSTAEEIEVVDAPHASLDDTGAGRDEESVKLSALRQLALVLAADVVDASLRRYLEQHGIPQTWSTQERILVFLTPEGNATAMIDSGRRNARRYHGDLTAAYMHGPKLTPEQNVVLEHNLDLARASGARIEALRGDDPAQAIAAFARTRGITQIYLGYRPSGSLKTRLFGTPVSRLARAIPEIDVRVFPI